MDFWPKYLNTSCSKKYFFKDFKTVTIYYTLQFVKNNAKPADVKDIKTLLFKEKHKTSKISLQLYLDYNKNTKEFCDVSAVGGKKCLQFVGNNFLHMILLILTNY